MMFKDKHIHKLYAFALAAVFALTLAGCGGGGGGGTTAAPVDPPVTVDPAAEQRTAISNALDEAKAAVAAVNDEADDATVDAADKAIADATAAINAAGAVPDAEKAANSGTVAAYATALTMAKESRTAAMQAAADEAQMAVNAMARKLRPGLGITSTLVDLAVTAKSVTGTFDRDGDDTTLSADNPLTVDASGADTPSAGGWSGTDYVDTDAATKVTTHVVAYNNQAAPKQVAFEEKHAGIIGTTSGSIPQGSFANFKIAAAAFASGAGSKTHEVPTGAGHVDVRGTFDGGMGTFRCNADCTSSVSSTTGVSLSANWVFIPDAGAMATTPDADYQVFGWWARDDGTTDEVRVAAFTSGAGTGATISSGIAALQGTATYAGGAAGKVSLSSPLSEDVNVAGAFTADAMLMVDFGNGTAGGDISGTIDNFSVGGEAQDWSIELKKSAIADSGDATTSANPGMTVWTIGGQADNARGSWTGSMYATDSESNVPQNVTGTFRSQYRNIGRMVGAFGADKQ